MLDSVETAMVTFAMFAEHLFGGGEIVLVLAVVLIFFGAKKLPDLGWGSGNSAKQPTM